MIINEAKNSENAVGYPTDAIIALTYRCDARCEMCNIWQLKPQEFLSVDDYAKVPSSLKDINVSGGEAFMRKDVVDIVKVIHQKCGDPRIVVSTNDETSAKVALGTTHQRVNIRGVTSITSNGVAINGSPFQGGLLALPTNIGSYSRDVFSVVPEVQVNLGYQIHPNVRLFGGYNFLYWSNVARASEQINRNINPSFIPGVPPPTTPLVPPEPSFRFINSGYWAQGLNFGVAFQW